MTAKFTVPALVDPLSVILSTELYLIYQEIHHPREPPIDSLKRLIEAASPDQRAFIAGRAKMTRQFSDAVLGALDAKH